MGLAPRARSLRRAALVCASASPARASSAIGRQPRHFSLRQDPAQRLHSLIDFLLRNDVRRQEAKHGIVRAVDQQPLRHRVQHRLFAGHMQLHAEHQAESADFFDARVLARQFVQLHVKVAAHALNGGQQFIQNVAEFQGDAAGQRAAAERRTVHARLDRGRRLFVGHDHAQRNAARQRLGSDHDVGHDHVLRALVGEVGAGASHPALGLVGHQQGVMAVGQFARLGDEFGRQRIDAALALNQFQHDARGAIAEGGFQRRDVVDRARSARPGPAVQNPGGTSPVR